jgi:S-adenosylmethionine-dependent methyltransferase
MMAGVKDEDRFETDATRYGEYLESPEGRLRTDLTFGNLQEFLPTPPAARALSALDLGGGTGAAAIRLARLGIDVTLLDSSRAMLDLAQRAIAAAGVGHKITVKRSDATRLADSFPARSFDIILCHNVLEFVDDPTAALRGARRLMRNSSAIVSVLVRHQAGEVLKAALLLADLASAEQNLTADWGQESLYGGKVRLFTPEALDVMLKDASLTIAARRGVRVIADYLPPQISRSEEYDRIFTLERKLGERREFFGVARYMQALARAATAGSEGNP